jgi:hypothetical protein
MILEPGGRVRLTPRELDLIRRSAALNGKTVTTIATLDELLAAVVEGLQPSMAADLLRFLERRSAPQNEDPRPTPRQPAGSPPRLSAEETKRGNAAARWLIERNDPDFSLKTRFGSRPGSKRQREPTDVRGHGTSVAMGNLAEAGMMPRALPQVIQTLTPPAPSVCESSRWPAN